MDRAEIPLEDLVLDLEIRAARAVPALVGALVGVPGVVHSLEDLLHAADVPGVGGADEEVVRDLQQRQQRPEALRVAVGELLGLDALGGGGVGDRLAVLVGAGEKEHVLAPLAHVAGEHVGGDLLVRVAHVRLGVDVVDRGRDVEGHPLLEAIRRVRGRARPRTPTPRTRRTGGSRPRRRSCSRSDWSASVKSRQRLAPCSSA